MTSTTSAGVLNEVYYPTIDRPQIRAVRPHQGAPGGQITHPPRGQGIAVVAFGFGQGCITHDQRQIRGRKGGFGLRLRLGGPLAFELLLGRDPLTEGLPLGFATVALAAYMRRTGMDVAQVGAFVGSFYLPWAFKWAWAPLVDLVRLQRFGGRKAWIVICQILMIITLYGIAQIDYTRYFDLLIAILTVSYQAARAALTNPADALRYE